MCADFQACGLLGNRLTFSLDLEHADGVLRGQVPELAGRERVSSLSQGADGRPQEEWLEER